MSRRSLKNPQLAKHATEDVVAALEDAGIRGHKIRQTIHLLKQKTKERAKEEKKIKYLLPDFLEDPKNEI